jgi:PDZ domain-containing protein
MQQNPWDLPEPSDAKPVTTGRTWKPFIILGVLAIIVLLARILPVPLFYAYMPGPVRDVNQLVAIEDAETYTSEGKLLLTTVGVDLQVTFAEWFGSLFDRTRTIILKEQLTQGRSLEELRRFEEEEMQESKRHAMEVALSALGLAEPEGDGARVVETVERSPADGVLREGDEIVKVDGSDVATTCDVGRAINEHDVGEEMSLVVDRDGRRETLDVELADNPQAPGTPLVGIVMEDINYSFDPGLAVDIDTDEIGGPSGGLMLTLALYDRLTPEDLTGGRVIAGTGTIECDGGIGPIGGIEQKVAGAENEGAQIFFAPLGNSEAAEEVAGDLRIVAVGTFDDAVDYLEGLD